MKLQDQVISLELAKKMKELGFEQDSLYFYGRRSPKHEYQLPYGGPYQTLDEESNYSAYTVAELGEMFPKELRWYSGNETENLTDYTEDGRELAEKKLVNYYYCTVYINNGWPGYGDDNEANTRAQMLICLKENNLLEDNTL